MSELRIRTAEALAPLLEPSRYKGAWGGRGSGKSHFFAELLLEDHLRNPGLRSICIREELKSLKESAKHLIEAKLEKFGLGTRQGFKVFREVIEAPGGGLISFAGMKDHTAESIKSMEGMGRAWVEEAQSLSARSMELLLPTIRVDGSEVWFSWNPRYAEDPVDQFLRVKTPENATVVRCNWSDNPWLPQTLDDERRRCLKDDPEKYPHIWEGEYIRVVEGAYFADQLEAAAREGRITSLPQDRLQAVRCYWDIGGTSNRSDATVIWVVQRKGEWLHVIDYYEAQGQDFAEHVGWLRRQGYDDAVQVLPHDGHKHDTVFRATPRGYLTEAGFRVEVTPNMGAGAAMKRIDAVRRLLPRCKFDAGRTEPGRAALGWYHAKIDEHRRADLGPEHDWSSHAADAFGYMAQDYFRRLESTAADAFSRPLRRNVRGVA